MVLPEWTTSNCRVSLWPYITNPLTDGGGQGIFVFR